MRLAILRDYLEEGWPSMDLVGEMLARELEKCGVTCRQLVPSFRRRLGRLGNLPLAGFRTNADRLLNRHFDYPRFLRGQLRNFNRFHVVDHSYSQLVHSLPGDVTGVFCHDLDVFRCLLDSAIEPRPRWFRAIARRILTGFQKAAVVFYSTDQIRRQIVRHGLIDPERLRHAPYGVAPEFMETAEASGALPRQVGELEGAPYLLHVGSCIPRKRIDVLLDVFAEVRRQFPALRLVKVGAAWSSDQREQIDRLGLQAHIVPLSGLERSEVAALYRAASLVLLTSEAEGFGLPVIEAMACGSIVVASNLDSVREVGGDAVVYCPVADLAVWCSTVERLLRDPGAAPTPEQRRHQASRFTWAVHARTILDAYTSLPGIQEPAALPTHEVV